MHYFLEFDKKILVFLNNLGTDYWDAFWLFITDQFHWVPYFLFLLFLLFKKYSFQKGIFILIFVALMVAFSDQFTNLIRIIFHRQRPINDNSIKYLLRHYPNFLTHPQNFSFTSGHATTSIAVSIFIYKIFRPHYKYLFALFLFPLFFGYSRLYLGVHFPLDIFFGYGIGFLIARIFFTFYILLSKKLFFKKKKSNEL